MAPLVSLMGHELNACPLHCAVCKMRACSVHNACVQCAQWVFACSVHHACVKRAQCVREACTMRACSVHSACVQRAQCVRAACTMRDCARCVRAAGTVRVCMQRAQCVRAVCTMRACSEQHTPCTRGQFWLPEPIPKTLSHLSPFRSRVGPLGWRRSWHHFGMLGYTPALCPEATATCTKNSQGTHNACVPHLCRVRAACTICACSVHSACVRACSVHNACVQCAQLVCVCNMGCARGTRCIPLRAEA